MKSFVLPVILLFSISAFAQEEVFSPLSEPTSEEELFPLPPEPVRPFTCETGGSWPGAEFPGGQQGFRDYLRKSLIYPESAIKAQKEGKCYVSFVIDATGKVKDARITRAVPDCPECDAEALRAISAMPLWSPARENGKTVAVSLSLPTTFKLPAAVTGPEK